jgi:hypothetical protein
VKKAGATRGTKGMADDRLLGKHPPGDRTLGMTPSSGGSTGRAGNYGTVRGKGKIAHRGGIGGGPMKHSETAPTTRGRRKGY